MKKTKTTAPHLLPIFSRRIGITLIGLWLTTMLLLTVGTAQFVLEKIVNAGYNFPEYVGMSGQLEEYYPTEEGAERDEWMLLPGSDSYCMLKGIVRSSLYTDPPHLSSYPGEAWFSGIYRSNSSQLNTAILFVDNQGNLLHQNGDFFYFRYCTADTWTQQSQATDGYAWVDFSDKEDSRYSFLRNQYTGFSYMSLMHNYEAIRMTGYFDGSRFEPLSMASVDYWSYLSALDELSPATDEAVDFTSSKQSTEGNTSADSGSGSEYTLPQVDAMGLVEWDECYDHTANAPADKELVTIYAMYPEMMLYDGDSVRYQAQAYDDLVTLLDTMGYYQDKGSHTFHQGASQINLWNAVIFGLRTYWDFSEYDFTSNEPWPEAEITIMTAVQASPLLIAAEYLRTTYLITAALVLVAFLWLRSLVKKHVSNPMQAVNKHTEEGWTHLPGYIDTPPKLQEVRELVSHYHSTQRQLYGYKNDINRLQTALTYAQTAEENRRQMTSHIAHELKTPLAVIHSYTEGLQEHIAEEKRDKYLEVILSETERMDAMVLEMLDLSRLEAGRVKLAQDEFSLLALCRSVFEKLELAVQAKELRVSYTCYCSDTVTADESRIRQVMENFATNAIRHTPHGGEIRICILRDSSGTTFSMENDGENLPAEVLSKVWDSFWRQDESRSSPGTGLGLAICKGIISLHGGTCAAYNTKKGVEFRFRI